MSKIFSILFLCLLAFNTGFSQSKKGKTKSNSISKKINNNKSTVNVGDTLALFKDFLKSDTFTKALEDKIADLIKTIEELDKWEDENYKKKLYEKRFLKYPVGWVNDFENIFIETQLTSLDSLLENFEKVTNVEIAIVTIDSSVSSREDFDNLILVIANSWGVGKENKNNGIVIGISKSLKKIRIQNGKGIVKKLTDFETKKIISSYFIPEFITGNYYGGCYRGITEIMKEVR